MNTGHACRSLKPRTVALAVVLAVTSVPALAGQQADSAKSTMQEMKHDAKRAMRDAKQEGKQLMNRSERAVHDAWLQGKLETTYLLNRHLNNFTIDSEVKGDTAYLSGTVESDIDRELAEEIALGIEGISQVENHLVVDRDKARAAREDNDVDDEGRGLARRIEDATTTAIVKSKLLFNDETSGMNINVDTENDVVTLRGTVKSSEEKALAEQIATNTKEVASVRNQLEVKSGS